MEDLEGPSTTDGEFSIIKIKKNISIYFIYEIMKFLRLSGYCKNIIRGVESTSIIFDKWYGEYL